MWCSCRIPTPTCASAQNTAKNMGKNTPLRVGGCALFNCAFMRIFRAISRQIVQGGLGKKSPEFGKYWANHLEPFKEITCRAISLSPLPESFKSFYTLLPTSNAPTMRKYRTYPLAQIHWHIIITYPKLHSKTRPFRQYSHIFSHSFDIIISLNVYIRFQSLYLCRSFNTLLYAS